jgi:hypothetical protein
MPLEGNARSLIRTLATNCQPDEEIADAQILSWAASIGIASTDLRGALAFARKQGWLGNGSRAGWTKLTQAGWENGNA